MRARFVLLIALVAACSSSPSDTPDAGPGTVDADPKAPDAAPGVNCNPTDPRSVAPQVFVGPTGLQTRMLNLINGAQSKLDIQMYLISMSTFANAIVAAKNRGVAVRVIMDPSDAGNTTTKSTLDKAGVPNKWSNPAVFMFSHAKYLIVDGKTAVITSANFNSGAMTQERNYGMVDDDPDDMADLQAIFDADWAGTTPDTSCTRLLVSPVNAKPRLVALIDGAQTQLSVEALYLLDSQIQTSVVNAAHRGVNVRVILSNPATEASNTQTFTFLAAQNVPARKITTFDVHAKLVIADGVAFIGSENLSLTSLTKNREVGGLVTEASQVKIAQTQFDADWSAAVAP